MKICNIYGSRKEFKIDECYVHMNFHPASRATSKVNYMVNRTLILRSQQDTPNLQALSL